MEIPDPVERFIATFEQYVSNIAAVSLGEGDERYRKILYFTILEGLSKARYPSKRPGEAFSAFVVTYCGWSDGDRVSLPHLVAALERSADTRFDELRKEAYSRYQSWGTGGPLYLDKDPTKADVQRLWPTANGEPLLVPELMFTWLDLQHRSLLYAYRSKLAHESREPTLSFDPKGNLQPFYNSAESESGIIKDEWHLVYPVGFLAKLCRAGIDALKIYCLKESKDPYESFRFGSFLLDSLNDLERHPVVAPFVVAGKRTLS